MGGEWRGRRLQAPRSKSVRPSAGRVKESLFSILESNRMKRGLDRSFESLEALDLYAGAGGLGLEFLSRGGDSVRFVEKAKESIRCLHDNIKALDARDRTNIVAGPVMNTAKLWGINFRYDLVFADPPYDISELNQMVSKCAELGILKQEGILIVEHDRKRAIHLPAGLELLVKKDIGPASLSLFIPESR